MNPNKRVALFFIRDLKFPVKLLSTLTIINMTISVGVCLYGLHYTPDFTREDFIIYSLRFITTSLHTYFKVLAILVLISGFRTLLLCLTFYNIELGELKEYILDAEKLRTAQVNSKIERRKARKKARLERRNKQSVVREDAD